MALSRSAMNCRVRASRSERWAASSRLRSSTLRFVM
jgi:hypothetical protein